MTAPRARKPRGRGRVETPEPTTWRERIRALRYIPPLLKMVWETHRGYTLAMGGLRLIRSFVPVSVLWVGKLIIDTVLGVRAHTASADRLWKLVALEFVLMLLADLLGRTSSLIESQLGDLFSNRTSVLLMEHAATLDLYHFEDPAFYDQLDRARRQTTGRVGLLSQLYGAFQDAITLVALAGALLVFNPWLVLLLVVAVIPSFLGEAHYASREYSLMFRWTPERRLLDYLRYLGASDETAKEIQMFGLSPYLIDRFRVLSTAFYEQNRKLARRKAIVGAALAVLGSIGYYAAYVVILIRTISGGLTIGTLTFLAASFMRSRDLIQRLLFSASDVYQQSLYLKDMFDFFDMRPAISSAPGAPLVPSPFRDGFTFEDVGFRYPGSERWAVRHVSFHLGRGERVAFVGENGAGKTTLTKLLARLYDPSEGRILLDGRDLREYDLASVRQTIGVIFQDFVRYDMRFDENIGVGRIDDVQDYLGRFDDAQRIGDMDALAPDAADVAEQNGDHAVPAVIQDAADKSLASSLLPRLEGGYRQMLGRRFDGGVDLSGGEWQKIALARSYMRDAQVLILDEPTAALDARAEYEVFVRFSELVAGRTAVLISHRFSTVRMADRIIVLRNGEIVEDGSHEQLVGAGGLYGELFAMQAQGYR
ncbi:MAG: ABC transporter ATP-binding protein/permease [Gemmatimonadota bacterium]|nr:ABC transporter ATP-binding protein/permease [Gemmatimonadota bacterium]